MTADSGPVPDVSVVIVNWHSSALLGRCLRTLDALQDDVTFEVIVVDNGSRDGVAELVRRERPGTTLIELPENLGFGAANNRGFQHTRGRYVLLLNPDTVPLPGMLTTMVGALDGSPGVGCVGARHWNPDMSLQWSIDDFPTLLSETLHYTDLHRLPGLQGWLRRRYPRWSPHTEERDVDWVNGACMMVRREVVEQTQGFDEYFFLFAEELDWCLRIWEAGWRIRFLPSAELIHELGGTFGSTDGRRLVLLHQSSLRYFRKNKSRPQYLWLHAMTKGNALVRVALIAALAAWEKSGGRPISAAAWEVLTQHPGSMTTRQRLQMWWAVGTLRTHARIRPADPAPDQLTEVAGGGPS